MRVFISYAREDEATAKAVQLALHKAGHEPLFDQRSIECGEDFRNKIHRDILSADAMVFLLSRHAVAAGAFTHIELQMAEDRWAHPAGYLLPLQIDDVPITEVPEFVKAGNIVRPTSGDAATAAVRALQRLNAAQRWRSPWVVWPLVALFFLVAYPLLLPLLSAGTLRVGSWLGAEGLHDQYARVVRGAYKVDDAAMFGRLDYYQILDLKSNGRDRIEVRLPVVPMQNVEFAVEHVGLRSELNSCAPPRELGFVGTALVDVELGPDNQRIFTLDQGSQKVLRLSEATWRRIQPPPGSVALEVGFRPREPVRNACLEGLAIDMRVTVKVFKSLVNVTAGNTTDSTSGADKP